MTYREFVAALYEMVKEIEGDVKTSQVVTLDMEMGYDDTILLKATDFIYNLGNDINEDAGDFREPREDNFRNDVEADADTLASAGFGTDEDYGYYGPEE